MASDFAGECLLSKTMDEGVKVAAQVHMLRAWGYNLAQSFRCHHPMAEDDIAVLTNPGTDSGVPEEKEVRP